MATIVEALIQQHVFGAECMKRFYICIHGNTHHNNNLSFYNFHFLFQFSSQPRNKTSPRTS